MLRTTFSKIKCSHHIGCCLQCPVLHLSQSSANHLVLPTKTFKDKLKFKIPQLSAFESVDCLKSINTQSPRIVSEEAKRILKKHTFLKNKRGKADALYILHHDLADLLVAKLDQESLKSKSVIFEINPGPGILTGKLLEAGFRKIKVFETKPDFLEHLLELQKNYPKQLEVHHMDLLSLSRKLCHHHCFAIENHKKIFEDVTMRPWSGDHPPLILTGVLHPCGEVIFLRYLFKQLSIMQSIYSYGRAELLVFLSGREIEYIFSNPNSRFTVYRYATVIYQLFYDVKVICKESRNSFYPLQKISNQNKLFPFDSEHLYLVKIIPKKDLFNSGLSNDHLKQLLYFVRHLLHRRTWPLIQHLRKWMPETEIYKLGYTMKTKTGDLHPEEFMHIFKLLIKQPDYNSSIFQLVINHNLFDEQDEIDHSINLISTV